MPMVKITLESGSNEQRRQNETVIKAKTGPDGIARFSNTKPGKYSLTVDELAPPALADGDKTLDDIVTVLLAGLAPR